MDTEELLQCGRFDCGAWIMPTLYVGPARDALSQGDNVVMTGSFVNAEGGPMFQVTAIETGRNIMDRLP
jgi:hypothetical protein